MASTIRLDIDRERAKYALECADGKSKNYGAYIQSMPMMIHNNGLRNALGFAYANGYLKKKADWKLVFDHIVDWLREKESTQTLATSFEQKTEAKQYMEVIIDLDNEKYRFAYQETISLLNWIRKLAKSE